MIETITNLIMEYAPYIAMIIGFAFIGLTMFKKPIMWIVEMTRTKRDDKIASYVYAFLEKFSISFTKLAVFAKEYKKNRK